MAEYCVAIEETIVQNFLVEADSPQDAIRKMIDKYKSCEAVVDQGELCSSKIRCVNGPNKSEDEETEWEDL